MGATHTPRVVRGASPRPSGVRGQCCGSCWVSASSPWRSGRSRHTVGSSRGSRRSSKTSNGGGSRRRLWRSSPRSSASPACSGSSCGRGGLARARGRALENDVRLAGDYELAAGRERPSPPSTDSVGSGGSGPTTRSRPGRWSGTVVASVVSLALVATAGLALATGRGGVARPHPRHRRCLRDHRGDRGALRLRAPAGRGGHVGHPSLAQDRGATPWRSGRRNRQDRRDGHRGASRAPPGHHHRVVGRRQLAVRLRVLRHDVPGGRRDHSLEGSPPGVRSGPAGGHTSVHPGWIGGRGREYHYRVGRIRGCPRYPPSTPS